MPPFNYGDEVTLKTPQGTLFSSTFIGFYKKLNGEEWCVFQAGENVYFKPASDFNTKPKGLKPLTYRCVG